MNRRDLLVTLGGVATARAFGVRIDTTHHEQSTRHNVPLTPIRPRSRRPRHADHCA